MGRPFTNVGELKKEILKLLNASFHKDPKIDLIIRYVVFLRDELRCVYCKKNCAGKHDSISVDHIVPSSKGGGSSLDNLVTSCKRCNEKKANEVFSEKANSLIESLIWQTNKRFLKHLDFEVEYIDLLEAVIASVEKRVLVFWQGQQHDVLEWRDGFTLRNTYTGEFVTVNPPDIQQSSAPIETEEKKKKRPSSYERLERIMHILCVSRDDVNT
jgi:hypothetical protein